jgi:hypothetical protein
MDSKEVRRFDATLRPPERTPVLLSLDAEQIAALIKLGQDLLKRWCRPEFCSNAETRAWAEASARKHRQQARGFALCRFNLKLLILYSTRICPYHAACSARTKRVLGIALEKTRVCLGLADDFARGIITKRIVELAKAGERNPDLLCEGALKKLRDIIRVAPTRRCRATGRGWPPPPFLEGSVQGTH